jgi:hypothetical protein
VKVVVEGSALASLSVGSPEDQVVRFAAAELADYLERISGARLGRDGDEPTLWLGLDADLPAAAADAGALPPRKEGYDGYRLAVTDDAAWIVGSNGRGVLYGVYDLLERLGCRWYYPTIDPADPEIIPSLRTVELPALSLAEASPFKYRVCHPNSMIYSLFVDWAKAQADWAAKARYNVMMFYASVMGVEGEVDPSVDGGIPAQALEEGQTVADVQPGLRDVDDLIAATQQFETTGVAPMMRDRGMLLEGPNHCMLLLMPNALFDEHPDWFGEVNGKRTPQVPLGPEFCWSHPDAVEAFCDNAVRWLQANPHVDVFSCCPNDGGRACECARCADLPGTDRYSRLMNRLLERMRDAGLDVELEILGGYPPVTEPPTQIPLHPDIRVHWAHWGRPMDQLYSDPTYSMRDNLDTWVRSGVGVTMVNYLTDSFASPVFPPPATFVMQDDNAYLAEHGFVGVMSLIWSPETWWSTGLNGWLALSWMHPDRALLDLLDDYSTHYYSAAPEPARAYHRLIAENPWLVPFALGNRWEEPILFGPDKAARLSPLMGQAETLLDEIERGAGDVSGPEGYRVRRLLAQGRATWLAGRARVRNVSTLQLLAAGDVDAALPAVRAALEHEVEVVDPAFIALGEFPGVMPTGLIGDKLVGGAAERIRAQLDELAAVRTT